VTGRLSIEDSRGVRVADLNSAGDFELSMVLVGQAPFFLRTETQEALLAPNGAALTMADLRFAPITASAKGSLDQTFRRCLFATPFGKSFYSGVVAVRGPGIAGWNGWYGSAELKDLPATGQAKRMDWRRWGWISLGAAAGLGVGGGVVGWMARKTYDSYLQATTPSSALKLKQNTRDQALAANVLFGVSGAAALAGITFFVLDWSWSDHVALAPSFRSDGATVALTYVGSW
jgi:hypothetical protein